MGKGKERKFSPDTEKEIADKYSAGASMAKLQTEYGTCYPVVSRIIKEHKATKPDVQTEKRNINEFEKRAKSILWRQEAGNDADRKSYHTWLARISELEAQTGANYSHSQSVVQASKNFACLGQLFREYDLSAFDPSPESHPNIKQFGNNGAKVSVFCEGTKQSYKESLRWAIETAGAFLRTGQEPTTCPCDTSFYLYQQAIADPKDFLGKVGQVESRVGSESEDDKKVSRSTKRTISEIDAMIAEITQPEEDESCELEK